MISLNWPLTTAVPANDGAGLFRAGILDRLNSYGLLYKEKRMKQTQKNFISHRMCLTSLIHLIRNTKNNEMTDVERNKGNEKERQNNSDEHHNTC